jgi:hypothetical protein
LLKERSRPVHKFKAIVITTGGFDETTLAKYRAGDYKARPDTTLELWDRNRLIEELHVADQKELIAIVGRYYQ